MKSYCSACGTRVRRVDGCIYCPGCGASECEGELAHGIEHALRFGGGPGE